MPKFQLSKFKEIVSGKWSPRDEQGFPILPKEVVNGSKDIRLAFDEYNNMVVNIVDTIESLCGFTADDAHNKFATMYQRGIVNEIQSDLAPNDKRVIFNKKVNGHAMVEVCDVCTIKSGFGVLLPRLQCEKAREIITGVISQFDMLSWILRGGFTQYSD